MSGLKPGPISGTKTTTTPARTYLRNKDNGDNRTAGAKGIIIYRRLRARKKGGP